MIPDTIHHFISYVNRDYVLEYVSPVARALLGYDPNELVGKNFRDLLHPSDVACFNDLVAKKLQGEDTYGFTCRLRHKDGRYLWFETIAKVVRHDEGILLRLISVRHDIAGSKDSEDRLARLNKQYELIFTGTTEGIMGFDENGTTTFVNPAAAMMLGYTEDEFIGTPQHRILHHAKSMRSMDSIDSDKDSPIYSTLREGTSHFVDDDVFWRKDGTSFPVQYTSTPIVEDGKITGSVVHFRDISDQKRMSQQLAHAVRIAGLGHWEWDIVNDHITLSDQMQRILGLAHDEAGLTYATFLEFVHPDDVQRVQHAVMNSLHNKYLPLDCDWRIIRNDGIIRHLHGQGEVLFDTTGDPVRMIGTVRDITEWKEQERLLYENQSLMKYNPDGVCALDLTGKYTDVNDAFEKLVGYTKGELIGKDYRELIVFPEDVPLAERLFRAILNGESQQNVEFAVRRKDGKRVEVSVTTAPILVRGELVGLYVILKDVTEHKLSRQKLMQSEERYRQLIENSLDAIGIHDGDKWLFMNTPGLKMFGAESETDMIGKPVSDFVKPEDRETLKQQSRIIIEDKQPIGRIEQRWVTVDGRQIDSETIGLPIKYENKPAVQIIVRDITERKRSDELLLKSEKLSAAGQLAAGVAHEIKNPLTALKGFTKLLMGSSSGPEGRYLSIMQTELDRIETIVNELLILAKPQAVLFRPQSIENVLQEVITLLNAEAVMKNVVIESDLGSHGTIVNCDKNQLKQVFVNIIKNAIDAMPKGGRLSISATVEHETVCVQFRDEGEGIPEDVLAKLGEPFFTTKEKGTGLGLLMSHKIILAHQGTIDISSVVGKGTTVSVVLPLHKDVQGVLH